MGKYSLVAADDFEEWDSFVDRSPQGTIFSKSYYLLAADVNHALFYVLKGQEKKAAVALTLSRDGGSCILDDLVIYNGIMFQDCKTQKPVKERAERFEIVEHIISELVKQYSSIEMSLVPQLEDMRPFLWHNYDSDQLEDKFKIDIRYTSYLNISELAVIRNEEETNIFLNLDTLRQRNIRQARNEKFLVTKELEIELFMRFYTKLMRGQGEEASEGKLLRIKNLIHKLIKSGNANVYFSRNATGDIGYITIFCHDKRRSYYLFGAGSPEVKGHCYGTIAFWDAFKDLSQNSGVTEIDLEGINSPKRGWFKLSFGGDFKTYYQVKKQSLC